MLFKHKIGPEGHLTSDFWKALGTYWYFKQNLTNNSRIEKPLTRWIYAVGLYIVIRSCGTDKPQWNKTIGTFGKSIKTPCLWVLENLR